MIRLRIRTFLRFRFAAIRRMAAAGPAEYIYTEIYKTIDNQDARTKTTAKPYTFTDKFIIPLLRNVYKGIPDEYWFNNYAKIELPSGGKFYLERKKNPDIKNPSPIFAVTQSQQAAQAAQKAVTSGPAAGSISGFNRNPGAYDVPPKKGGKNRRTKRHHHKKRQTKRRR